MLDHFEVLAIGERCGVISANHARSLRVELPSGDEKLHRARVIASTRSHLIVERMRPFDPLQINLHSQSRTI